MQSDADFYRQILDESSDPIFSFLPDGTYRYVNQAFARGVGRPADAIIGHRIWDVFPPAEADKRYAAVRQAFETGEDRVIEVKVEHDDTTDWYLTTVRPIKHPDGSVATVVCVSKNITDRKRAEERLQFFATTDELTGVANRRTGLAILQKLLDMARRSGRPCGLIYADVDGLKRVNDTHGHQAGDRLIVAACDAMRLAIRQSDTLCRMGGDEFLILLPDCGAELAGTIDDRIGENLAAFNSTGAQPWEACIARGVTAFDPATADTAESLLHRLDLLMYANKRTRR